MVGLLTRNTGRDDNQVGTSEGLLHAVILGEEALDFLCPVQCIALEAEDRGA
jgi:hypothetical protein